MKYTFEADHEIRICLDCPLLDEDKFGAWGCRLINDYLENDISKSISNKCKLIVQNNI